MHCVESTKYSGVCTTAWGGIPDSKLPCIRREILTLAKLNYRCTVQQYGVSDADTHLVRVLPDDVLSGSLGAPLPAAGGGLRVEPKEEALPTAVQAAL